jgi:Flp pilus assembly protein TadD
MNSVKIHRPSARILSARALGALAIGIVAACSRDANTGKIPLSRTSIGADSLRALEAAHALLGPGAKAALDRGNAFFRKSQFAEALTEYRAAAALAPQHAAPLFGIYMVGRATNNTALADSALAGIRLRGGSLSTSPHSFADTALQRIHKGLGKNSSSG